MTNATAAKYNYHEKRLIIYDNEYPYYSTCENVIVGKNSNVYYTMKIIDIEDPDELELSFAVKYLKDGNKQWQHEYAISQLDLDDVKLQYIYVDNEDCAYYAGSDPAGETNDEYMRHTNIVKYDSLGDQIWQWTSQEYCQALIIEGDDRLKNIYLLAECEVSYNLPNMPSLYTVDMTTGKTINKWRQTPGRLDSGWSNSAMALYPDGGVLVLQDPWNEDTLYLRFSAFDQNGQIKGEKEFQFPQWALDGGHAFDLTIDRYGNGYANITACRSGYQENGSCDDNTWGLVKITPDGDIEWSRLLTGNEPSEASIDDTDEYIIVGYPFGIALGPDLAVEETDDDTPMLSGDDDADQGCGC